MKTTSNPTVRPDRIADYLLRLVEMEHEAKAEGLESVVVALRKAIKEIS